MIQLLIKSSGIVDFLSCKQCSKKKFKSVISSYIVLSSVHTLCFHQFIHVLSSVHTLCFHQFIHVLSSVHTCSVISSYMFCHQFIHVLSSVHTCSAISSYMFCHQFIHVLSSTCLIKIYSLITQCIGV